MTTACFILQDYVAYHESKLSNLLAILEKLGSDKQKFPSVLFNSKIKDMVRRRVDGLASGCKIV